MRLLRQTRDDNGFTLIELLVVVIIIGILAAIAIPIFMNQRKKGVDASIKSDLHNVANQLETYYAQNLTYPIAAGGSDKTVMFALGSETAVLSTGNNVRIVFGTGSEAGYYAICGWNSNATAGQSTSAWVYNSRRGGYITALESCPSATDLHTPNPA